MTISLCGAAFLDAIAVVESEELAVREGIDPYFILCGGGSFEHLPRNDNGFPLWPGLHGSWGVSHAAGRYQFQPGTYAGQAFKLKLTDFSPASQDIAAWDLAQTVYHARTGRALETDLEKRLLSAIPSALQPTWSSITPATNDRFRGAWVARRLLGNPLPPSSPSPTLVS